jgi:hypothetical protein
MLFLKIILTNLNIKQAIVVLKYYLKMKLAYIKITAKFRNISVGFLPIIQASQLTTTHSERFSFSCVRMKAEEINLQPLENPDI